jgi:hypothetical protein
MTLRNAFEGQLQIGCAVAGTLPARATLPLCSALLALLFGTACPERVNPEGGQSLSACAEVGQRCEFSPGKLGSCVKLDSCTSGNCFVCQSQH